MFATALQNDVVSLRTQTQKETLPKRKCFFLEVPPRFELGNNGFADRGLTTWLWHHILFSRGDYYNRVNAVCQEQIAKKIYFSKFSYLILLTFTLLYDKLYR